MIMKSEKKPKIRYSPKSIVLENSDELTTLINNNQLDADGNIVLLTCKNSEIIEELYKNDDDYYPFSQSLFEYFGEEKIKSNSERALFAFAREIDRDNSTNVWRYGKNRESFYNMINFITNSDNDFFARLERGDISLPDDICNTCGTGLKSLSSKICKYLNELLYHKDDYYINDSYVRHMLLFYLDFYGVNHEGLSSCYAADRLDYIALYNWLSKLHSARDDSYKDTITRNQLDHILWYCYKSYDLSL